MYSKRVSFKQKHTENPELYSSLMMKVFSSFKIYTYRNCNAFKIVQYVLRAALESLSLFARHSWIFEIL